VRISCARSYVPLLVDSYLTRLLYLFWIWIWIRAVATESTFFLREREREKKQKSLKLKADSVHHIVLMLLDIISKNSPKISLGCMGSWLMGASICICDLYDFQNIFKIWPFRTSFE
jgi:hypothetical protein